MGDRKARGGEYPLVDTANAACDSY
jgi:hypothetical protein